MELWLKSVRPSRIWTWMGCYGCRIPKPTLLYTTLPSSRAMTLQRKMTKALMKKLRPHSSGKHGVVKITPKKTVEKDKKKFWVTGTKMLKSSEQFTPAFCTEVCKIFQDVRGSYMVEL